MKVSNANLIRESIKVAVSQVVPVFSTRPAAEASCITDLLFAVTQIIDVDDRDLIEGQNGSLPNASHYNRIQLCVVFQQGAVHLKTQQVGGKTDLPYAGGELASLRGQSFVGLAGPQNLPPAKNTTTWLILKTQPYISLDINIITRYKQHYGNKIY